MHASTVRAAHTAAAAIVLRERGMGAKYVIDVEAVVAELRRGDAVVAAAAAATEAAAAVGHVHRCATIVRRVQRRHPVLWHRHLRRHTARRRARAGELWTERRRACTRRVALR